MQQIQLYIEGQRLDLFEDENISLTDSIQNVRDIAKIFTSFTKDFNLPASRNNNKIFKHYYNPDITNGFDGRFSRNALIKINGADYKEGRIKLMSVSMKDNKAYAYKVVFFGKTVELPDLIGDDLLSELSPLDKFNHDYNYANVKDGFEAGLSLTEVHEENGQDYYGLMLMRRTVSGNADIIYPFISHTKQYVWDTGTFKEFNGTDGLGYGQLKPAISLYNIVKAIEEKYSLTFTDNLFNENYFKQLYMWMHRDKGVISSDSQKSLILTRSDFYDDLDSSNPDESYNTYLYTSSYGGVMRRHVFSYTVTTPDTGKYNIEVYDAATGTVFFQQEGVSGDSTNTFQAQIVSKEGDNDNWNPVVKLTSTEGVNAFTITLNTLTVQTGRANEESDYSTNPSEVFIVSTVLIKEQMPKMKVMDFLTSLFKMFNLTAYVQDDGAIYIDTLDNFYAAGGEYDITKYVEVESNDVERALPYKKITFEYEDPDTFLTLERNRETYEEFGDLEYTGSTTYTNPLTGVTKSVNFDGGNYDVKVAFEHMLFERMTDQSDESQTDLQWGWFVDDDQKPTVAAPLVFFNVNESCANTPIRWEDEATSTTYNRPSNTSVDETRSLNFGAEIDEFHLYVNTNSLFEIYYKNYIEALFDGKSRIFKHKVRLPLNILLKHKLNDRFIINGRKHKINSITTNLQQGSSEVELINEV
jgi:hypothetical protein